MLEFLAIILSWTQPYLDYLVDEKVPEDEVLSRQIIQRAKSYTVISEQLYKWRTYGVYQRCISSKEGVEIL